MGVGIEKEVPVKVHREVTCQLPVNTVKDGAGGEMLMINVKAACKITSPP